MTTKTVDITQNTQTVAEFIRELGTDSQPIDLVQGGRLVARLIPPGELSQAEKEEIVRKGWEFVTKARAKNKGVPEREIAKEVNAAIERVRSH